MCIDMYITYTYILREGDPRNFCRPFPPNTCVNIHTQTHTHTHTHIYVHENVYAHMFASLCALKSVHVCMYAHDYAHVCVFIQVYEYACSNVRMYVYKCIIYTYVFMLYTYIHICQNACTCVCMYINTHMCMHTHPHSHMDLHEYVVTHVISPSCMLTLFDYILGWLGLNVPSRKKRDDTQWWERV